MIKTLARLLLVPGAMMTGYLGFAADENQGAQGEEVYELSPFAVESSEEDVGYYASSTLAGTRMNSKLKDIASSITVVTAQQLEDTSAVDLNDIFLYESNTEGTGQYTEFSLNRYGAAADAVQSRPETANRIRGIGSAAIARDYFVGFDRVPIDSYNVDRLTINRGPNSVLYGLGSPSGIVNASPAKAVIGSNNTRVEFRYGKWNDQRGSINLNRTLIEDKLAVRFAALVSDRGIPQEPALDKSDRQYFAISYRPFESTTIRANFENVTQDRQGVNAITPADLITPWVTAGRPMWNPTTLTATYQDGRTMSSSSGSSQPFGAYAGLRADEHLSRPFWVMENGVEVGPRLQRRLGNTSDLTTEVDTGLPGSFLDPDRVASGNSRPWVVPDYYTGVTRTNQPERLFFSHSPYERNGDLPGYIVPGVQDKSLYDWDELNISAANYNDMKAKNYQFMVEQQITDSLFIEAGVHHEEYTAWRENGISSNQAKIYVDVNTHYLDGTPNPWAGMPFMETAQEVAANVADEEADTYRATMAWELDFTDRDGVAAWLGRHNIMGLAQKHEQEGGGARYRPVGIDVGTRWDDITADGTLDPFQSGSNVVNKSNRRYYIGDPGGKITKSTGQSPTRAFIPDMVRTERGPTWAIGSNKLRHFLWEGRDGATDYAHPDGRPVGTWVEDPQHYAFALHGSSGAYRRELDSYSGAIQSYFWDDRIVTTFGWRKDTQRDNRPDDVDEVTGEDIPAFYTEEEGYFPGDPLFGYRNVDALFGNYPNPWDEISGTTTTRGIVFHATDWMSVHYNESDNFSPSSPAISFYKELLPNPTGEGKDWGVAFSLLENKLIAKINWYEASSKNARNGGDTTTVVTRTERVEYESNWGYMDFWEWNIEQRDGLEFGTLNFFSRDDPETAPYLDELYELSGLPPGTARDFDYGRNDTRDISSKGTEISLSYNPTNNFNIKMNITHAETIIDGAAPNLAQWISERLPLWSQEGATNSNFPMNQQINWWTGTSIATGEDASEDPAWEPAAGEDDRRWNGRDAGGWVSGVVLAPLGLVIEQNGKPQSQSREWRANLLATYRFTEGALQGFAIGGSVRWEDKASIGYYGDIDDSGQLVYDIDRPVWDPGTTYWDFWASYNTRIMDDRVRMRVQLNLRNIFEDGGLKRIRVNPDGQGSSFRIVDPGSWFVTTSFDF